jgi:hypothetical protein
MALLVIQVAVSGELVEVFEMPVDDVDGHRMLDCANEDERVIHRAGQIPEDGEVWIDLIDRDGETLLDQVACFHGSVWIFVCKAVKDLPSGRSSIAFYK